MMKKLQSVMLLLLSIAFVNVMQAAVIRGKILERGSEQPLIGAAVIVDGSSVGVTTNVDGEFTLDVAGTGKKLIISYIGYLTREVTPSESDDELLIYLDVDALGIDEVVVTGQGAQIRQRRISSNIVGVNSDQMDKLPSKRIDEMLQTALPNVQINVTTGQPGGTSIMKSRGFSSAQVNSTPVIYVDGVRVDNLNTVANLSMGKSSGAASSAISDIPMENIERVEYVPGGAATTLYGSDAANGVLQIFTRKGSGGGTNVHAEIAMGVDMPTSQFYYFDRTKDLLQKNGFTQSYRFGMDGGNEDIGYSLSGSMTQSDGTIIHNKDLNKKYDISTGLRAKLNDKVEYQSSFGVVQNSYGRSRNGNQGGYTGLWVLEGAGINYLGLGVESADIDSYDDETFQMLQEFVDKAEELQNASVDVTRFQTSHSFVYRALDNLTFKLTSGVDYRASDESQIITNEYLIHTNQQPEGTTTAGSVNKWERDYFGLTFDLNAQWRADVNAFSFITTAGGQYFSTDDHQSAYQGQNLSDGSITIEGAATTLADEYWSYLYNYSLFIQENIGINDKLYIDLGLRSDYNTSFGPNVGWQFYPKVGMSYSLLDESFMSSLRDKGTITSFKLRANYGIAGSYAAPFSYQKTVELGSYLDGVTASFGNYGNPDLAPEKKHSYEAGFDLSLLYSRLSLGATYYYALTKDALFEVPAAPSTGYDSILSNVGEIRNKGIELFASVIAVRNKDWNLTLNASLNTNDNIVLSTGGAAAFAIGGMSERTLQTVVEEGQPVGYIRGYETLVNEDGTFKETLALQNLGSTIPTVFGNYSINLSYKRLSMLVSGDYQAGAYVHSFDRQFRFRAGIIDDPAIEKAIPEGSTASSVVWDFSNFFVEKSDYMRIRTINVSYDCPIKSNSIKSLNLSLAINNPYTFTKCSVDPEAVHSGALSQGAVAVGGFNYATYSNPRQVIGTVRLTF